MTASDKLAEAAREELAEYERFCGGPLNQLLDTVQVRLSSALAAYDGEKDLREAEQDFIAAVVKSYPYMPMTFSESVRRMIAARKAKEVKP